MANQVTVRVSAPGAKDAVRDIHGLSDAFKKMRTQNLGAGDSLRVLGAGMQATGAKMSMNLTLPILAAGAAITKTGLDFDTSLRRIIGLTDVTEGEIDGIREALIKLGPEVGRSPQELADAFYFVASAGFTAEGAMDVLNVSARASAAGMGTTEDVAKALAASINAYGKENLTAAQAGDILTAAVGKGSAEAADYAGVLGNVVNTAALMGVSFDETTAAISAMTNVGIGADEAVTSLNQVMLSLLNPTKEAGTALEGVGLSAEGLRQQMSEQGLLSMLRTLEERFAGNDEAIGQVFGNVRALRGVLSLLGIDSAQLSDIFATTADATGDLGAAFAATEGPQRDLDRSTAKMQGTLIKLSADVMPIVTEAIGELAQHAENLGKWWASLDEGTRRLIVQFAAGTAAAGPLLLVTGKLVGTAGSLIKIFGSLGGAIVDLTAKLWLKIAALKAAEGGWINMAKAAAPAGVALGVIGAELLVADAVMKDHVRRAAETVAALDDITDASDENVAALRRAADAYNSAADAQRIFGILETDQSRATREVAVAAAEAADGLNDTAAATDTSAAAAARWTAYAAAWAGAAQRVDAATTDMADGVHHVAMGVDDDIGLMDLAWQGLPGTVEQVARDVGREAVQITDNLSDALRSNKDEVADAMDDLVFAMNHPLKQAKELARIEGALSSQRLAEGLASNEPWVVEQARQTRERLIGQWESLSGRAYREGTDTGGQLGEGISDSQDDVLDPARTLMRRLDNILDRDYQITVKTKVGAGSGPLLGGGRQHGGPVRAHSMHEVTEGGEPELLHTGAKSYLLTGSRSGRVEPIRGTSTAPVTPRATPVTPTVAPPPGMPTSVAVTVNLSTREFAQHQKHYAIVQAGGPAFR